METASNPDWDVAKLKLQPQSIEAERSVIGALLISSDSWDGVAEVVAAADFTALSTGRYSAKLLCSSIAVSLSMSSRCQTVCLPQASSTLPVVTLPC